MADAQTGEAAGGRPVEVRWPESTTFARGRMARHTREDHAEAAARVGPILAGQVLAQRARIDIARACNLRCPYCVSGMGVAGRARVRSQSIPFDILQVLVPQLVGLKVTTVNLYGGGEPLLHPDIAGILDLLAAANLKIQIITNGTLLDDKVKEAVKRAGRHVRVMRFSIHGVSSESFQRCTRTRHFDRLMVDLTELAHDLAALPEPPIAGLFVPVTEEFSHADVASFVERAAGMAVDFLWFGEDFRSPSQPEAVRYRYPALREFVMRLAPQHPELDVHYTTPVSRYYGRATCYEQLLNMHLIYHPPSRRVLMVRCCNYFPRGLSDLPPDGAYTFVEPSSLHDEWQAHLRNSPPWKELVCTKRHMCLACGRNEKIAQQVGG